VRYKLAILKVLAKQPGGRATLDEVRREAGRIVSSLDQVELKRFNAIGDVDICHSGLVLRDDAGWQITDAGLALLDRLEDVTESSSEVSPSAVSAAVGSTDDFIRNEEPLRPFDAETEMPLDIYPAPRNPTGSKRGSERANQPAANAALGLLALLSVIACVFAAIAFGQIQSLKSDIAVLRRELLPVKERLAKFEQAEKQRQELEQQDEAQNKSETETKKSSDEAGSNATALELTREEIQMIRDYIKPAPSAGAAAPTINVGDTVAGAMIPLPSQLAEKIPKLRGARFTTRNGSIIIVRRDSRQADAVLPPN
jgi:hypothetical protein